MSAALNNQGEGQEQHLERAIFYINSHMEAVKTFAHTKAMKLNISSLKEREREELPKQREGQAGSRGLCVVRRSGRARARGLVIFGGVVIRACYLES